MPRRNNPRIHTVKIKDDQVIFPASFFASVLSSVSRKTGDASLQLEIRLEPEENES